MTFGNGKIESFGLILDENFEVILLDEIFDFVLWTYQLFILFSLYFETPDVVIISKLGGERLHSWWGPLYAANSLAA